MKVVHGFAGTGKTTIAKMIVEDARAQWLFGAFTGKAALVMRERGCVGAKTIHSLIYRPNGEKTNNGEKIREVEHRLAVAKDEEQKALAALPPLPPRDTTKGVDFAYAGAQLKQKRDPSVIDFTARVAELELELDRLQKNSRRTPAFQLWDESPLRYSPGIVLDEGSMLDGEIMNDILSFGKKVLVLMDPMQLPPVGARSFFEDREPDHLLTEVHRQARESGILDLATFIREGGGIFDRARERWERPDCEVRFRGDTTGLRERVLAADQVLVGTNENRHVFNRRIRELSGRKTPWPEPGERVVCLQNNRELGLMNGGMWIVREAVRCEEDETIGMSIVPETILDGEEVPQTVVSVWQHNFESLKREAELKQMGWRASDNVQFAHARALTVHKAQGSQYDDVVLSDDSRKFKGDDMQRRWLYTGITRASKRLLVIV
jgi:exodeoxyribonuclease-5